MFHVKKKQMTSEQKLAELIEGIWGIGAESPQSTAPPPRGIITVFVKSNPGRTVRFCNSNCVRVSGGSLTPSPFLVSTPFPFTPSSIRSSFSRTWTGSPPARTSS